MEVDDRAHARQPSRVAAGRATRDAGVADLQSVRLDAHPDRTARSRRLGSRDAACSWRVGVPALLGVEVELGPASRRPSAASCSASSTRATNRALVAAQRELRVDVDEARDVDDGEEQVAELREHARVGLGLGCRPAGAIELGLDLGELLAHLRERRRRARASRTRPPPPGVAPCGRGAGPGSASGTSWKTPERPSCSVLIASHRSRTRPGRVGDRVAEDVRVAADELRVHGAGDRFEIAVPLLLEQQGEEVRLEQQVAELVEELRRVAGVWRRRRPRTPPRPCAARSCARSAPGPRGSRGAGASSAPAARRAPRQALASRPPPASDTDQPVVVAVVSVAAAGGANPVA